MPPLIVKVLEFKGTEASDAQEPRGQTWGPAHSWELAQGVHGPGEAPCRLTHCDPPGTDSSQRLSSLASGNSLNSLWLHLLPMKLQKLQLSCVPPPPGPSCTAGGWTTAGVGPEGSTLWGQVLAGCLRLTLGKPLFLNLGFLACEMGPRAPPGGHEEETSSRVCVRIGAACEMVICSSFL